MNEALEFMGLSDAAHRMVSTFSGGMVRRLEIAQTLIHRPRVLFLDEPTIGLDPVARRVVWGHLDDLRTRYGTTLFVTTHYMEEAQELSNHIAIEDHGKQIACGTHDELVKLVGQQTRIDMTVNTDPARMAEEWRSVQGVTGVTLDEEKIGLLVEDSNEVLPRLFESAAHHSALITSVDIREPNLEAVFLHLTGRALRD